MDIPVETSVIDRLLREARDSDPGGPLDLALYELLCLRREVDLERVRRDRWHATYNAAVAGLCGTGLCGDSGVAEIDHRARLTANYIHGKV